MGQTAFPWTTAWAVCSRTLTPLASLSSLSPSFSQAFPCSPMELFPEEKLRVPAFGGACAQLLSGGWSPQWAVGSGMGHWKQLSRLP